jgi:hypothetical protein
VAENETLTVDGRTASRWTPLRDRILSGHHPSDCFVAIQEQFYQSLRRTRREIDARGVPFDRLLSTAYEAPCDLEALVRQTRYQDHAKLLLDVVRCQAFLSFKQLIAAWLSAVWDSVRDLLQIDLCDHTRDFTFEARIRSMVRRLARLMARNPSRIPGRPRRSDDDAPDDLDDLLGRSIR